MKRLLQLCLCLCVFLVWASQVAATPDLMGRLPLTNRFRCLVCHTDPIPTPTSKQLNPFGTAFEANGQVWNATLARAHSDGDNCTNGFELGDEDGNGVLDAARTDERSNPGAPDCTLQLTTETWAALKTLFR